MFPTLLNRSLAKPCVFVYTNETSITCLHIKYKRANVSNMLIFNKLTGQANRMACIFSTILNAIFIYMSALLWSSCHFELPFVSPCRIKSSALCRNTINSFLAMLVWKLQYGYGIGWEFSLLDKFKHRGYQC